MENTAAAVLPPVYNDNSSNNDRYMITTGKTNFNVKICFGKIPLEDILKSRLMSERAKKS